MIQIPNNAFQTFCHISIFKLTTFCHIIYSLKLRIMIKDNPNIYLSHYLDRIVYKKYYNLISTIYNTYLFCNQVKINKQLIDKGYTPNQLTTLNTMLWSGINEDIIYALEIIDNTLNNDNK